MSHSALNLASPVIFMIASISVAPLYHLSLFFGFSESPGSDEVDKGLVIVERKAALDSGSEGYIANRADGYEDSVGGSDDSKVAGDGAPGESQEGTEIGDTSEPEVASV